MSEKTVVKWFKFLFLEVKISVSFWIAINAVTVQMTANVLGCNTPLYSSFWLAVTAPVIYIIFLDGSKY